MRTTKFLQISFWCITLALVISLSSCENPTVKPKVEYYFTVGNGQRVQFSPGYLQYDTLAQKYHFAQSQLEPSHPSVFDGHWVDEFVWGHGNDPLFMSEDKEEYQIFYDWGEYPIDDYPAKTWRTLTQMEWQCLVIQRPYARDLFGTGCVDSISGVFLLPDNWQGVEGVSFGKTDNHFSLETWKRLEDAGAVFIPMGVQEETELWTADVIPSYSDYVAATVVFYTSWHALGLNFRPAGFKLPVRLVRDYVVKVTPNYSQLR